MKKFIFIIACILCLFPISTATKAEDNPKLEAFVGYSYLRDTVHNGNLNGVNVEATFNFTKNLGITADYASHRGSSNKAGNDTLLVGPTFKARLDRVEPFVHALFGIGREVVYTHAFGGGIDIKTTEHIAIRPIQADYMFFNYHKAEHNFRLSSGIVFRF